MRYIWSCWSYSRKHRNFSLTLLFQSSKKAGKNRTTWYSILHFKTNLKLLTASKNMIPSSSLYQYSCTRKTWRHNLKNLLAYSLFMTTHNPSLDFHNCSPIFTTNVIMDIHDWIMDDHNSVMDIHNSVMDMPACEFWTFRIQLRKSRNQLWIAIHG